MRLEKRWVQTTAVAALLLGPLAAPAVATEAWDATGSLTGDRGDHTATLLDDGRVLVAGGDDAGALATSEVFDPATGAWSASGALAAARSGHTATLLQSGRVLAAGGTDGSALSTSELYDPGSGTWSATGNLAAARAGHTATLLQDGRVLVAGGADGGALSSCEIYDPGSGTWFATGSLAAARSGHSATLLADGRVLVTGGESGGALATSEIFDPGTGLWSATGSLAAARSDHTATRLTDGRILVAGGSGAGTLGSSEIFDPATGAWTGTGSLGTARFDHSASLLPDGRVLVAGGRLISALASSEVFDPGTGAWTATQESPGTARTGHTTTLLLGGRVLAAGGFGAASNALGAAEVLTAASPAATGTGALNVARRQHQTSPLADGRIILNGGNRPSVTDAEIYDPEAGTWSPTGSLTDERRFHTSTLLPGGKVLATGGFDFVAVPVGSAEIFDPDTGTWSFTDSLITARFDHAAALLDDGRVLIGAGSGDGPGMNFIDLDSAEIYDPETGLFSTTGSLNTARTDPVCTVLTDGRVVVTGGIIGEVSTASAEIYDPGTGLWTATDSLGSPRTLATATLLHDGRVLVVGGVNQLEVDPFFIVLGSAEIYDPATGLWSFTGSLSTPRFDHAATLLADGRVLISGGFDDGFGSTSSLEIFDPTGNGGAGSFSPAGTLGTARAQHTADLLPDGRVLVAGGSDQINLPELLGLDRKAAIGARRESIVRLIKNAPLATLGSSELFDPGLGFQPDWRPQISGATESLADGEPVVVIGSRFRGVGEAAGGNGGQSSPSDHPVVQIHSLENDRVVYLPADPSGSWSDTSFTSEDLSGFPVGHYRVTVFSNGIPSESAHGLRDDFGPLTDLRIAKTDGLEEIEPGETITYTIVGSNAGPNAASGAQVTDGFSFVLQDCTWTCVGAGGGACTPGPVSGSINDTVSLPVGATVTYTAQCTVSPAFQGKVLNTANISVPEGLTDSLPANNTATDETVSICMLLDLSADTLDTTQTFSCREIRAGDGLAIVAPGDVTFDIDVRAVMRNGFSVGSGASFRVQSLAGAAEPD